MNEGTEADTDAGSNKAVKHFLRIKTSTVKKAPMSLKRKLFEKSVMPTILYGSETWVICKKVRKLLAVPEKRIERIVAGMKLLQTTANEWLRGVTKVKDWVTEGEMRKLRCAAKISALKNEEWVKRITEWTSRIGKGGRGGPAMRWSDC